MKKGLIFTYCCFLIFLSCKSNCEGTKEYNQSYTYDMVIKEKYREPGGHVLKGYNVKDSTKSSVKNSESNFYANWKLFDIGDTLFKGKTDSVFYIKKKHMIYSIGIGCVNYGEVDSFYRENRN